MQEQARRTRRRAKAHATRCMVADLRSLVSCKKNSLAARQFGEQASCRVVTSVRD